MTPLIDPTADVDPTALLGAGCVVGAHARIGPGCVLAPYAVVGPHTTLGAACVLASFAVVGGDSQDRTTPPGAATRLVCGPENVFREHVTISRGSLAGGGETRIGASGLFMAGVHVGHDCRLGHGLTLANGVSLAGHVELGDGASLGGHVGVHQFVRIGEMAFVAANSMVAQDVPPFSLAAGDRARLYGLNVVGLRRAGFSAEVRLALKRVLARGPHGESGPEGGPESGPEVRRLLAFLAAPSGRGLCRSVRGAGAASER